MKKNFSRVISALMALIMVFLVLPVSELPALAASTGDFFDSPKEAEEPSVSSGGEDAVQTALPETYSILYVCGEGAFNNDLNVTEYNAGDKVVVHNLTVREKNGLHYSFTGWYEDEALTVPFNGYNNNLAEYPRNLVLYASWAEVTYFDQMTRIFTDEHINYCFQEGNKFFEVYNNSLYTSSNLPKVVDVFLSMQPASPDNHLGYAYEMKVESKTGADKRHMGGYYYQVNSSANRIFYYIIYAKIPVGYSVGMYNNAIGSDGRTEWLTDNRGSGEWQWYIGKTVCGSSGDFLNLGFVAVYKNDESSPDSVDWYVGYSNLLDGTGRRELYQADFMNSANPNTTNIMKFNGNTYQYVTSSMTWEEAKEFCEAHGGHLATITSAGEQSAINCFLEGFAPEFIWLGASDAEAEGTWKWVTGEPWEYTNWSISQPDDCGRNEDMLMVYSDPNDNYNVLGAWNDYTGNTRLGFILEIEADFINIATPNITNMIEFGGNVYQYKSISMTWEEAKEFCETHGGHLATITSAEEQSAINSLLEGFDTNNAWLGASDAETEGIWKWVTGEPWEYTNWYSSQPDDFGSNEDMLMVYSDPNDNLLGSWNDYTSNKYLGFILEIEAEPVPEVKGWSVANGLLTISSEYISSGYSHPWAELADEITSVIVEARTEIEPWLLAGLENVTSVSLPNTLKEIGYYAFNCCNSLININIPDSVTSISNYAFYNCKSLVSVTTGNGLNTIGVSAFEGCSALSKINLDNILHCKESIGVNAFLGTALTYLCTDCPITENIGIPSDSVESVNYCGKCGSNAYWTLNSDGLLSIVGSGNMYDYTVDSAPWKTLADNNLISRVSIGDEIIHIGANAFNGNTRLVRVIVGSGVESLGEGAFVGCTNLHSVYFTGDYHSGISANAFGDNTCGGFRIQYYANAMGWTGVTTIGDYKVAAFGELGVIEAIQIGLGLVLRDDQGLIYNYDENSNTCSVSGYSDAGLNIDALTIPKQVTANFKTETGGTWQTVAVTGITADAFTADNSSAIASITIGENVTNIASGAFANCKNLKALCFNGNKPENESILPEHAVIVVRLNGKTGWGTEFDDAKVYIAFELSSDGEKFKDSNHIIYTLNANKRTALVGTRTTEDGNFVNTSGSVNADVSIPDFVYSGYTLFMVTGFDRYAFYKSEATSISFGRFIGEGQTAQNPAIWDCTFREMPKLTAFIVTHNENYTSDEGVLYGHNVNIADLFGNETEGFPESISTRLIKVPQAKILTDGTFTVPDGISTIERYAFAGNRNVRVIDLNNVTVIGSHAFYNNGALTTVNGEAIVFFEDSAFENCVNLSRAPTDTDGIISIGKNVYLGANFTGVVHLGKNLKKLGDGAFLYCKNVTGFAKDGENNLFYTDSGVLYEKTANGDILKQYPLAAAMTTYDMTGKSIYRICAGAFSGARALERIVVSDSTVIIGREAFSDCARLESVKLGENYYGSSTNIDDGLYSYSLFGGCRALTFIEVAADNKYFLNDASGVLYSKDMKTLYCYPAGLQRISYGVSSETERIYDFAFAENTNLNRVVIPNSEFDYIGTSAFAFCSSLKEVYISSRVAPLCGNKVFEEIDSTCKVKYYKGYTDGWRLKLFGGIPVETYSAIETLENNTISTDDYIIVVADTNGKPLPGTTATVKIYAENESAPCSEITLKDIGNGIYAFSLLDDNEDFKFEKIHLKIEKENYLTYNASFLLDFDSQYTLITMQSEPTVVGVTFADQDINSRTVELNKKEYGQIITGYDSNNDPIYADETVKLTVSGFCDKGCTITSYAIIQNGKELCRKDTAEQLCTFDVAVEALDPKQPIKAVLTVLFADVKSTYECVLNINIFDFILTEKDVHIDSSDLDVNLNDNPTLAMLLGSGSLNFNLGKKVSVAVTVDGSDVTLNVGAKGSKSKSYTTDYEKGFYAHTNGRDNTYNFRFVDNEGYVYNVRFTKNTMNDGFSYYRCRMYYGTWPDEVCTFYGVVNCKTGRSSLTPKASMVFLVAAATKAEQRKALEKKGDIQPLILPKESKIWESVKTYKYVETVKGIEQNNSSTSFSVSINGSLKFRYSGDSGLQPVSGGLVGEVSFRYNTSFQQMIWVIPVYVEVEVDINGKVELKLKFDNGVSVEELRLTVEAGLTISAGVGCKFASVGIYGKAGVLFILDFVPEVKVDTLKLSGELGVYVEAFSFEKKWPIVAGEYYVIGSGSKTKPIQYNPASMFIVDDYEFSFDRNPEPRLVIIDNVLYKISFESVTKAGYDSYNSAKLVWSCYDPTTKKWSRSTIIDDNGFEDLSYSLVRYGERTLLCYTQKTTKTTADNCGDTAIYASALSIKYVDVTDSFNGASAKTAASSNGSFKYLPQIALVDGVPTAVWAENADCNMFGVSPNNYVDENNIAHIYPTTANSIYRSRLVNGVWSKPECVESGLSTVVELAVTEDGDIVYILDTDGDPSTDFDRALYHEDRGAVDVGTGASVKNITAYDNGIIYYLTDADDVSSMRTMTFDGTDAALLFQESGFDKAQPLTDLEGNLFAFLFAMTETTGSATHEVTGSALYGIFRDGESWGKPIKLVSASDGKYISSFDAVMTSADSFTFTIVYNDSDNRTIGGSTINYTAETELVIVDSAVDYQNGTVTVTVKNTGAKAGEVYAMFGQADGNGKQKYADIAPGETVVIAVSASGSGRVYVAPTADGKRQDNTAEYKMDYSDIMPFTKQLVVAGNKYLLVTLKNIGNLDGSGTLYLAPGNLTPAQIRSSYTVSKTVSLEKNNTMYLEFALDFSLLPDQDGIVTLYFAPNADSFELSENNLITVYATEADPDLAENYASVLGMTSEPVVRADQTEIMQGDTNASINIEYDCGNDSFAGIKVDGVAVNTADTARKLTLDSAFLSKLQPGNHVAVLKFSNKDAFIEKSVSFTIKRAVFETIWIVDGEQESAEYMFGRTPFYPNGTPEKPGYDFIGWDCNGDGVKDALVPITAAMSYTAIFELKPVFNTITWHIHGANDTESYTPGSAISYKGVTDKVGFAFIGWSDGEHTYYSGESLPVANANTTYTAVYVMRGDINNNGEIEPVDISTVISIRLGVIQGDFIQNAAADYDGNGKVEPADISAIIARRLGTIEAPTGSSPKTHTEVFIVAAYIPRRAFSF